MNDDALYIACPILVAATLTAAPMAAAQTPAGVPDAAVQGKTDVVVMDNGDRLTSEVSTIDRGRLRVKTDHLDTVTIEWAHISQVTTSHEYDVETLAGELA